MTPPTIKHTRVTYLVIYTQFVIQNYWEYTIFWSIGKFDSDQIMLLLEIYTEMEYFVTKLPAFQLLTAKYKNTFLKFKLVFRSN